MGLRAAGEVPTVGFATPEGVGCTYLDGDIVVHNAGQKLVPARMGYVGCAFHLTTVRGEVGRGGGGGGGGGA
jgi:hypothetical protein